MEKYFDTNPCKTSDAMVLHADMLTAANVVADNLFFFDRVRRGEEREKSNSAATFATSVFMLIAICEGILEILPKDKEQEGYEYVKGNLDDIFEQL